MRFKNILFLITILITLVFSGKAFPATYTYNSLNQLTEIDYGNGTVADYTYDAAGNRISVAVVDLAPPTGSVTINGGAATTNSTSVSLTVTATDNSGAVDQMMFSNDNITWSAWEPYATTKAWTLPSGDGVKTVYVQFQDLSGNISPVYSSNITLSTVIPTTIDLSVGSIAHPASAVSGATIPVTTTVANSGTGTSVGTYIFYFLSTDTVITSSDTYIGFEMVGSIAGGNSQSVTTSLILPSNLTTGAYYIGAIVDATNLNSESDENNNTASSSITINGTSAGPVDLVISSLTPPASANAGATVSLSTTVTNNGTSASTGGYIYYYLSTDAAITNADTLLGQTTIGGITGGGTQTVTASVVIPSNLTTGTYYIGAIADATNTNVETNENNNTASSAISITATSQNGSIDLAISSLVPPASANAGETITVPTTVINNGTGTSVESYVYYYISADPTIDITDTYLGYKIIGGINGGTTQNATASLILPSNLAGGTYYIGAIVDPTNSNTETDLTNNTASSSITVNGVPLNGPIDLAISSMTPPASANMGEMITMPVTIINNGTGRSVGSYIFYYLSTDPVITSADRYLGYHHVVDIDGGWTHSMTASITLPNNIYSGTYYIGAIVDPTNTNAESDETNNTAAVAITIHGIPSGPVDLSISSITPPATANAGDTITVPTTAVNNGTGTSTGTYIYYYLSTDPVITSADAFIGDTTIGGIAGSGSQSTTGSVILPSNLTTGTYYIGAIVDPGDNNAETDEANNTASTSIMINGTPVNGPVDLAISSITPPATANAGDTITVPTTAVNNGTGTSSGTYIHYYLSTDPAITSADTFIGYTTIGGIAGAGTQSVSTSVILPANLTTGTLDFTRFNRHEVG